MRSLWPPASVAHPFPPRGSVAVGSPEQIGQSVTEKMGIYIYIYIYYTYTYYIYNYIYIYILHIYIYIYCIYVYIIKVL